MFAPPLGIRIDGRLFADQIAVRVGGPEDRRRGLVNVREPTRDRVEIQEGNEGTVKQFVNVFANLSAMRVGQYRDRRVRAPGAGNTQGPPGSTVRVRNRHVSHVSPVERTHGQSKAIGHGSRRPKTGIGFGDAVSAEQAPVVLGDRSGAREDPLVGGQRHPVRTALDTRFVGRNPAGDTKRQPMLDSSARRKRELERIFSPRKIDGKTASAAGRERKSETNVDEGSGELHLEKTVTRKGDDSVPRSLAKMIKYPRFWMIADHCGGRPLGRVCPQLGLNRDAHGA